MTENSAPTPEPMDRVALREKYAEERAKRLRPEGSDQFVEATGEFAHYLEDPHTKRVEREPIEEELDVAILGSGFGGLMAGGRLREMGLERIRLIDKAGDIGGTWYWNRYPGAQCDVESYIYLPLLEETGYIPTEKYAHAPEIREHTRRVADHYGLYDDILFHTQITEMRWDESRDRWILRTDRGDRLSARFVCVSSGPLNRGKLPGVPGIAAFRGHSFHSSRWDYAYTGGHESGDLEGLRDKRVGVIGTGATALQIVPRVAKDAQELFVFQRTASCVGPRNNQPTDPEWVKTLEPGWQRRRMENFNDLTFYRHRPQDLVGDDWVDINHRTFAHLAAMSRESGSEPTAEDFQEAMVRANFDKMESLRARIDEIVDDPATAEGLKPWYRYFCKRPSFHDEYLQCFNQSNVTLVDTDGKGVERITERGVVVAGKEYELDCIIYATGFETATPYTQRTELEAIGRAGRTLTEHWESGMRTFHSYMTDGFPNLFFLSNAQGATPYNYTHVLDVISAQIAHVLTKMQESGASRVEPTTEAVDEWTNEILRGADRWREIQADCTPGYYNNEGRVEDSDFSAIFNIEGPHRVFEVLDEFRAKGNLPGLRVGPK